MTAYIPDDGVYDPTPKNIRARIMTHEGRPTLELRSRGVSGQAILNKLFGDPTTELHYTDATREGYRADGKVARFTPNSIDYDIGMDEVKDELEDLLVKNDVSYAGPAQTRVGYWLRENKGPVAIGVGAVAAIGWALSKRK